MLNFVLKQALNGAVTDLAAGVYATQSQSLYTLTVAGSDTIPDGLKLQRDGDDLVMLVDGEEVSRLTEFYSDEMAAQFSVNGSVDAASAEIGTSTLAELEGSGVVWPENELLAGLAEPASQLITPLNVAAAVAVAGGVVVANDSDSAPAPAPTLVISGGSDTPTNSDVTFTFTFDVDVEGFTADDVVVTGGTKGSFTAVSATEYSLVVTPDDDSTDDITVDVAAGAAQSTAGTDSEAAEQETQAVDTAVEPPTLSYTDSADASDQLTNDATVTVSDLDAGASWEYSTDSGSSWTAGSGSSFELSDGSYGSGQVQVRQTDVVGNVSDPASLLAVTVDTEVATPTVDITTDSADGSDRITNDATITVTGLESGASWEYSLDGGSNWSAGDSSDNSFELADGSYDSDDVLVRQTDLAGNVSGNGALAAATIDTTIATPALELASDSNIDDDRVTNDATVDVTGLDSTASWEYSIDGGSNWAAGSGSSFELDDGSYDSDDVLVRQTDVAGNVSGEAALQAAVIDTAAPAVLGIALDEDSGESASDNISSDGTVVISGLESGATWQYRYDGINWTAGSGSSFELAEGSYTAVQVRQIDLAGNEGPFFDGSSSADLGATVIDQTAPDLGLVDIVDTGISDSDGVTSTDTFTVTGLESGADWEYSVDGGSNWSTGSGNSFSVEDGAYFISVRQTDLAGNSDSYSSDLALTVDTTVATPTVNIFSDSADGSDRITNDATITVTGLEAGASWEYSINGGGSWSTGDSSDNSFELADGVYDSDDVLVRQTDIAGNVSSNGALAAATIDTQISSTDSTVNDGDSDGLTNDATVTVGNIEEGASWEYSTDSGSSWTPGSGSSFELSDGSYADDQIRVRQTDVAGNISSEELLDAIEVDSSVATPTVDITTDSANGSDRITNDATIAVSGLESGASWEYSTDGGSNWSSGDSSGNSFELADGVYTNSDVLVRQTDIAGNVSSNGALAAATIDTVAPAAPSVALVDAGSGGSTSDATVTISGLEADASWEYSTDSGSSWTPGSGSSFELSVGSYATGQVAVRQTDVAGNVGAEADLAATTVVSAGPIPVIFDFANGHTSSLDGTPSGSRVFSGTDSYEIYIIVPNGFPGTLQTLAVSERWTGTLNLGSDDKLILVGDSNSTVGSFTVAPFVYFSSSTAVNQSNYNGGYQWGHTFEGFSRQVGLFSTGSGAYLERRPYSGQTSFASFMLSGYNAGTPVDRASMARLTFSTEGVAPPLQINLGGISMTWNGTRLTV